MQSQGVLTIERMCQITGVSRAGFYRQWEAKAPDEAGMALRDALQRAAVKHRAYGSIKLAQVLRKEGFAVSVARVRRLRKQDNLFAVRRRKFVVTTDSEHDFLIYPNLAQYLVVNATNQLWVADITYVRLGSEFVYFAVVLDAFSRRVLGWALDRSLQTRLPLLALDRALAARPPARGLVHHSDRGSQYASNDYVARLEQHHITISMSRPARPWENARCERFMRTLKEEEIDAHSYQSLEELERNVTDFIEGYYNQTRLHAALGYRPPVEFEQQSAQPPPAALSFRRHQEIYPDASH
jgi:transposase InsO family protein